MDQYLIGAGALLTAGPNATIRGATLHAQPGFDLAGQVAAAVVDLDSAGPAELSRLLIVAAGWSGPRFHREVVSELLAQRECGLNDIVETLAAAVRADEIHLFARWQPDPAMVDALKRKGVRVISHPLEALGQASLVSGQRIERWRPGRAA
ncbi:MAG TPA: hypothetical protein VHS56_06940 [Candidatus Cybelea sp.]|nr:hypothetical protein [Candidatus Cybelea sp.]